ncbi:hypothetical protein HK101_009109 [Irineochytrium annulatum]|nr:hypothetical protein HK101_009109 [Irineochytrium annulatum]
MKVPEEEQDPDMIGFISIIMGVAGVLFKQRLVAWLSLCGSIYSVLTTRGSEREYKQGAGSLSFSIMGIVLLYVNIITAKLAAANGKKEA